MGKGKRKIHSELGWEERHVQIIKKENEKKSRGYIIEIKFQIISS
jgi:hypothetical protein